LFAGEGDADFLNIRHNSPPIFGSKYYHQGLRRQSIRQA
jgi:hypothetical protein